MKEAVILSMILDFGWKIWQEETKNMTPAELDNFISNKKVSVADVESRIEQKYGS